MNSSHQQALALPRALKSGDTIGVFTPSLPGYMKNSGLFESGVRNLEKLGFKVKLGALTDRRATQGYRSASGKERAEEFMALIHDPEVKGLISTIGGYNSSSMIPYLDFDAIRDARKVISGYSDVTSLHLAILRYSRLRTFYGPTVMCWFGEWPDGIPESNNWFLDAVTSRNPGERKIIKPARWSNDMRSWQNDDWKNLPREWKKNTGWKVLSQGSVTAPIVAVNLNTVLSAAGTPYWPNLTGKILLIEEMDAPLDWEERGLRQLELMEVFDQISGLIISKPEVYDQQNAPFDYNELIMEIVGERPYPIVSEFDCGHTNPMITIPQELLVRLTAEESEVSFTFLESACSEA